jgi:hypothetical protein
MKRTGKPSDLTKGVSTEGGFRKRRKEGGSICKKLATRNDAV